MKKVALFADTCIDAYHYGTVDRISPEAPIPVFTQQKEKIFMGMGLNVLNNLEKFELEVEMYRAPTHIWKHRYVDIKSKQQVLRVDEEDKCQPCSIDLRKDVPWEHLNAVVVSDYDKGYISLDMIQKLIVISAEYGIPIFIDTKKKDCLHLQNCYLKINEKEYTEAIQHTTSIAFANQINNHNLHLIVTLGENGAFYRRNNRTNTYKAHKVDVHDVTGAGDTFLSALVFQYLHCYDMSEAIKFAIKAASKTVQKFGTYAPSIQEVNRD